MHLLHPLNHNTQIAKPIVVAITSAGRTQTSEGEKWSNKLRSGEPNLGCG